MKPLHYIRKYDLLNTDKFDHNAFVRDLNDDLLELIHRGAKEDGTVPMKGFDNAVNAIRQKWDAISNKIPGTLPDKLWNYFYAAIICNLREEMYPEVMKQRREEHERRKKAREEQRSYEKQERQRFFEGMWSDMLLGFFLRVKPFKSFELLGIDHSSATEESIKRAYKSKAMLTHPDKGGSKEAMQELNAARDKCLAYINK